MSTTLTFVAFDDPRLTELFVSSMIFSFYTFIKVITVF